MHCLLGFLELLKDAVDFGYACSATIGYSLAAASVDDFWIFALGWRHRVNYRLNALECIVVDVDVLDCLAQTRNHACQILDVTHFLDLLNLSKEVVEVECVLCNLLLQLTRFLFVELLLCAFNE